MQRYTSEWDFSLYVSTVAILHSVVPLQTLFTVFYCWPRLSTPTGPRRPWGFTGTLTVPDLALAVPPSASEFVFANYALTIPCLQQHDWSKQICSERKCYAHSYNVGFVRLEALLQVETDISWSQCLVVCG